MLLKDIRNGIIAAALVSSVAAAFVSVWACGFFVLGAGLGLMYATVRMREMIVGTNMLAVCVMCRFFKAEPGERVCGRCASLKKRAAEAETTS